jgi:hypothetical protein
MMKLPLILTFALVAAAPALAAGGHSKHTNGRTARSALALPDRAWSSPRHGDRSAVYSDDGRLVGRDPDPSVRMRLRDEDAVYRGR